MTEAEKERIRQKNRENVSGVRDSRQEDIDRNDDNPDSEASTGHMGGSYGAKDVENYFRDMWRKK